MTRLLTFILLLLMSLALAWLFHIHGVQIQKQQANYKELRSYIDSHNTRLNIIEQRPELVIKKLKEPKKWKNQQ